MIEFQAFGHIVAKLVGGPHDGESLILAPNGSIEPPHQFTYHGYSGDTVGWHVYEYAGFATLAKWPEHDSIVTYPYVGFRPSFPAAPSDSGQAEKETT